MWYDYWTFHLGPGKSVGILHLITAFETVVFDDTEQQRHSGSSKTFVGHILTSYSGKTLLFVVPRGDGNHWNRTTKVGSDKSPTQKRPLLQTNTVLRTINWYANENSLHYPQNELTTSTCYCCFSVYNFVSVYSWLWYFVMSVGRAALKKAFPLGS